VLREQGAEGFGRCGKREIAFAPMIFGTVAAAVVEQNPWKRTDSRRHPEVGFEVELTALDLNSLRGGWLCRQRDRRTRAECGQQNTVLSPWHLETTRSLTCADYAAPRRCRPLDCVGVDMRGVGESTRRHLYDAPACVRAFFLDTGSPAPRAAVASGRGCCRGRTLPSGN
jgi:hypothetical protein